MGRLENPHIDRQVPKFQLRHSVSFGLLVFLFAVPRLRLASDHTEKSYADLLRVFRRHFNVWPKRNHYDTEWECNVTCLPTLSEIP